MKKLIAILMTIAMLLSTAAVFAEETTPENIAAVMEELEF